MNNEAAFLLFTQRIFDREQQSSYNISLQVYDYGWPVLSTFYNFTLVIIDDNDHAPRFDQISYTINISETTMVNTVLAQIHADDADEQHTDNSRVEYRLDNVNEFSIDAMTGELRLLVQLDREDRRTYEFDIHAFDHGHPHSLSSHVHCTIHLIDSNDNSPIFHLSIYDFNIPETWSYDLPIGYVHATDIDEHFSQISYRFDRNRTLFEYDWPFELTDNGTLYIKNTSIGMSILLVIINDHPIELFDCFYNIV
jgi:hypothetical protein